MGQRPIEIVLMRQLASCLAVPTIIVDRNLDLQFFNESAEPILGRRFEETGEIGRAEWNMQFQPSDANGDPLPPEKQSIPRAIDRGEPSQRRLWLTGLDGAPRVIEALAFPLETPEAGLIGAVGIFWEVNEGAGRVPHATSEPSRPSRSAHAVEVILLKRLADRLTMPTLVIDAEARLIFYNPAAEPLIGRPFADVGQVELGELYDTFQFSDEEGWPIKAEDHPLYIALNSQQPCYRSFQLRGLDGVKHHIEGTAFPLLGQCDRHLGAVGIFWEKSR